MIDKQGLVFYKGVYRTAQAIGFEKIFQPFLIAENFTDIIEIGTHYGGLTMAIRDALPSSAITTYDICSEDFFGLHFLKEYDIEFIQKNIFENTETLDSLFLKKIKQADKLLVCVDGGNKPEEFRRIAPYLRIGDTIMVHDYVENEETAKEFEKNEKWFWFECFEQEISEVSSEYNLQPIYPELLDIVWRVKRKTH